MSDVTGKNVITVKSVFFNTVILIYLNIKILQELEIVISYMLIIQ